MMSHLDWKLNHITQYVKVRSLVSTKAGTSSSSSGPSFPDLMFRLYVQRRPDQNANPITADEILAVLQPI